ncbi:MAG TPA: alpha/beta hydrolase, partial [Actinomycetes bacterium]|nr:alpha/beta hydrolase [Actinomycetes bacterium]
MTYLRGIRQPGLRWIVTAALLASLTGLVLSQVGAADAANSGSATAGAGRAGAATAHGGSKPTVVLVHGAWADSGSWDQVVARLQRQGYTVIAFPTPLRSLPDDSAYLAAFLSSVPGPIVLVGHSYGGAVITNAATGNENVKALVYVDAFLPAEGETIPQLIGTPPGSCVVGDPTQIFDLRPIPGAPTGVVDAYVKQSLFPSCFANDLPAKQAAVLAATQRPASTVTLVQESGPPAWAEIPSWALVGTVDRVILPATQLFMAERAGARIVKIKASHLPMISRPSAVTGLIVAAA